MSTIPEAFAAAARLREANEQAFVKLLGHLGRKEFDEFEACLAEDMVQDWPFLPIPSMPSRLVGARALRELIAAGMEPFDPHQYQIQKIHAMLDPEVLIAEYTSHSFFHKRQVPYCNAYISVMRFQAGKLVHWVEYLNPSVISSTMGEYLQPPPVADAAALA